MPAERLQKLLSAAGVASRREGENLIRAGRVRVDGVVVTELGARADPARQRIAVDGELVRLPSARRYVLLHKPPRYVTTARDPEGRPTVFDLLPPGPRLFAVGRLDWDSEGLLLMTDDGELAYRATHPRYGLAKEYHAWTDHPTRDQARQLTSGVQLDDGPAAASAVALVSEGRDGAILSLTLHEGRYRQARRMLAAVGLPVYRLLRVRVGPLTLADLASGEWRSARLGEVALLREALQLGGARAERDDDGGGQGFDDRD